MSSLQDECAWCLRRVRDAQTAVERVESAYRSFRIRAADLEAGAPDASTANLRSRCLLPIDTSVGIVLRHANSQFAATEAALQALSKTLEPISRSLAAAEACRIAEGMATLEERRADSCLDASARIDHEARRLSANSVEIVSSIMGN